MSLIILSLIILKGGNLLSSLSTPDISVGCSTSVMGIFGAYLAFLMINWDFLERYQNFR
jgi:hypothetical protein